MEKAIFGDISIETINAVDRQFACKCGASEYVESFGKNTPRKFEFWIGFNAEHAKCMTCGYEHNRKYDAKYN
jgi:hypothetical protein